MTTGPRAAPQKSSAPSYAPIIWCTGEISEIVFVAKAETFGEMIMSHFFAYLSRMKFICRWGLMHNTYPENIQEHSVRVAMVAHALAVIRNRLFAGNIDAE